MHPSHAKLRSTELGQRLEAVIDTPVRYVEYVAFSRQDWPAITALVPLLLEEFGQDALNDAYKQFCGAMVGEVMRRYGHGMVNPRRRVSGKLFVYGAVWSIEGDPAVTTEARIIDARRPS